MLLNLFIGFIVAWLVIITWLLYRTFSHYNKLVKIGKGSLVDTLEMLLKKQDEAGKKIDTLTNRCQKIENDGLLHIQKTGLIRYNPFSDTGGNQSFVLSLLNGKNDGVIISSLHSRIQTRWFAKVIKNGKGEEHELSEEEKKAILQSIRKNK